MCLIMLRLSAVGLNSGSSEGWSLAKVSLFVKVRKQGCRIESIPLKRLVELSGYRKRRWVFEDGWLILEAF
jgi:hypothetical protein